MSYTPLQNLFDALDLKIFGQTIPVHFLCTIINTSQNDVISPKNWHIGKIIPLNNINDSWHPSSVNEIIHDISSDQIDIHYPKRHSFSQTM